MRSLADVQARVAAALRGEAGADLAAIVAGDGIAPRARLAIYRHHFVDSLTESLAAAYPVVHRLVGDGFFRYAAHESIAERPPRGPCLAEWGERFAEFLDGFPPCGALAYLGDVARLEWAIDRASRAADAVPLDVAALRSLEPPDLERLSVRFDPSLALLASAWPVDAIWRANQPDADPATVVDAAAGGVALEVRRRGDDVAFRRLSPAVYAFRRALADGGCLAVAASAGHAADPAFDLAGALHELFTDEALVGFRVTSREPKERP
jgi:hypothetical protein